MRKFHCTGTKRRKADTSANGCSKPFPVPVLFSEVNREWGWASWKYFGGVVQGLNVVVEEPEDAEILLSQGSFGSLSQRKDKEPFLSLSLEEAFFLSFALGCLFIRTSTKELDLLEQWELFLKTKENFFVTYVAYHHFRTKGWVPKEGLKFGTDYVLYKQGPRYNHAEYAVVIKPVQKDFKDKAKENRTLTWSKLAGLSRLVSSVSKTLLQCNVALPENFDSPECLKETSVCVLSFSRWASPKEQEDERDIDATF